MADILIKGLELPPEGKQICLWVMHNGTVWHEVARDMIPTKMEAISVPEHGDLIDRDAFANSIPEAEPDGFENCRECTCMTKDEIVELILDAEVVLERTT